MKPLFREGILTIDWHGMRATLEVIDLVKLDRYYILLKLLSRSLYKQDKLKL